MTGAGDDLESTEDHTLSVTTTPQAKSLCRKGHDPPSGAPGDYNHALPAPDLHCTGTCDNSSVTVGDDPVRGARRHEPSVSYCDDPLVTTGLTIRLLHEET